MIFSRYFHLIIIKDFTIPYIIQLRDLENYLKYL